MGSLTEKGDSWFTGEKPGTSIKRRSTSTPRRAGADLLHVRDPPVDARLDQRPAGRLATAGSAAVLAPPGAPSFPRRPGRRRPGRAAAAASLRPGEPSPAQARSARLRCAAAVPGSLADPTRAERAEARDPDPRGRGPDPARPTDADVDLRRDVPRADDQAPRRAADRGHLSPPAPRLGRRARVHLHGGHNRTQFDGQPGGLTASHPRSFYCDIPRGLSPRESGTGPAAPHPDGTVRLCPRHHRGGQPRCPVAEFARTVRPGPGHPVRLA